MSEAGEGFRVRTVHCERHAYEIRQYPDGIVIVHPESGNIVAGWPETLSLPSDAADGLSDAEWCETITRLRGVR